MQLYTVLSNELWTHLVNCGHIGLMDDTDPPGACMVSITIATVLKNGLWTHTGSYGHIGLMDVSDPPGTCIVSLFQFIINETLDRSKLFGGTFYGHSSEQWVVDTYG